MPKDQEPITSLTPSNEKKERTSHFEAEQIYFSFWGSQSEEHKDYFRKIDLIATWIGHALGGNFSRHEGFVSSEHTDPIIRVSQTKEKFGQARVYCDLDDTVKQAKWYRKIYLEAKLLWPQYWKSILEGADSEQFLYETPEKFEDWAASLLETNKHLDMESGFIQQKLVYEVCGWELSNEVSRSDEST